MDRIPCLTKKLFDEFLKKIIGNTSNMGIIKELSAHKINDQNLSNYINCKANFPEVMQEDFASPSTVGLLAKKLEGKNHIQIQLDINTVFISEFRSLKVSGANETADLLEKLEAATKASSDRSMQRKLVATELQAVLCFLTSRYGRLSYGSPYLADDVQEALGEFHRAEPETSDSLTDSSCTGEQPFVNPSKRTLLNKKNILTISIAFFLTATVLACCLWPDKNADQIPPRLEILEIEENRQSQTISFMVTFSDDDDDNIQISLSADSIIVSQELSANVQIHGSGNTRTITLSDIRGPDGTYNITIAAGAVKDADGNSSKEITRSFVLDTTIPTLNMSNPVITAHSVCVKVYAADETGLKNFCITPTDITTIGFSASTIEVRGTGAVRELILSDFSATAEDGCQIEIAAGVAVDESGNKSRSITSIIFSLQE